MGTKCTPTYANILTGMFEENYNYHLIQKKKKKSELQVRYVRDVFITWTGTLNQLNQFIDKLK